MKLYKNTTKWIIIIKEREETQKLRFNFFHKPKVFLKKTVTYDKLSDSMAEKEAIKLADKLHKDFHDKNPTIASTVLVLADKETIHLDL